MNNCKEKYKTNIQNKFIHLSINNKINYMKFFDYKYFI